MIFQRSPWDLGDPGNTNVKTGTLEAKLSHTEDIGAEDFILRRVELLFQQASSVFISGGSTLNVLDLSANFLIFYNFNFFIYTVHLYIYGY